VLAGALIVVVTVVIGLLLLALMSLRLWRQVSALGRCVGQASGRLDTATAALEPEITDRGLGAAGH
jgi:hypothetical protein